MKRIERWVRVLAVAVLTVLTASTLSSTPAPSDCIDTCLAEFGGEIIITIEPGEGGEPPEIWDCAYVGCEVTGGGTDCYYYCIQLYP